jgi:FMN phosphatase YigB (HAD superfamily)
MDSAKTAKVALFDLDNTLFDHYHSMRCAIAEVQQNYAALAGQRLDDLVEKYNAALDEAYGKYLRKKIPHEETKALKVRLFFTHWTATTRSRRSRALPRQLTCGK